jgi:hypothetical protein
MLQFYEYSGDNIIDLNAQNFEKYIAIDVQNIYKEYDDLG